MGTTSQQTISPAPDRELRPRAPRAPLVHPALCRFADEAEFIEVTTLNISESGMLVRSPVEPPVGSPLKFRFFLESGFEIISGTGTVTRQAREENGTPTIGIAFVDLDPPKKRILARVVELHAQAAQAG